ncbi:hypothetical protein [Enterococcus sp. LJL51]|uniref:hypothetical protein n=1 Tax=Enterococcus sp. LJL51 TaxID=3416656 RepID=UPI003CFB36DC
MFETATDIGDSSVLRGENNRDSKSDVDMFKIRPAYDGAYKIIVTGGIQVFDENGVQKKSHPATFVNGPAYDLEAGKAYFIRVESSTMVNNYVADKIYEIKIQDPFDATKEYGVETLSLSHSSIPSTGYLSGFGATFNERHPIAYYKAYRTPSTVSIKALKVSLSSSGSATSIEIYNEAKVLIGQSALGEDGKQTVWVNVGKDQVVYTKVVNETPGVLGYFFHLGFLNSLIE